MNYIVFDLEWNQCPYGKDREEPELPFEIIEIGAVRMDSSLQILDSFHELIHPQVYPVFHFMTKEIISLREEELLNQPSFSEAAGRFLEWCGEAPVFCTWGSSDLTELQRNMEWYHLPLPFPFPLFYYDIQKIFSIIYEDRKTRRSLESAVDYLQLSKNRPFHNAFDDAYYTAEIMQNLTEDAILSNSSVDCFRTPDNRKQEIYINYSTYSKFISRPFPNKTEAMKDRIVASTCCHICGKNARKKIRWFSSGSHNYFCLAWCEQHGWIKGKIRLRQRNDGKIYVVKTLKNISQEDAFAIRQKQEVLRVKRRLKRAYQHGRCYTTKKP